MKEIFLPEDELEINNKEAAEFEEEELEAKELNEDEIEAAGIEAPGLEIILLEDDEFQARRKKLAEEKAEKERLKAALAAEDPEPDYPEEEYLQAEYIQAEYIQAEEPVTNEGVYTGESEKAAEETAVEQAVEETAVEETEEVVEEAAEEIEEEVVEEAVEETTEEPAEEVSEEATEESEAATEESEETTMEELEEASEDAQEEKSEEAEEESEDESEEESEESTEEEEDTEEEPEEPPIVKVLKEKTISVSIEEVEALGKTVEGLVGTLKDVTDPTVSCQYGIYRLSDKSVQNALKKSKDDISKGVLKPHSGESKLSRYYEEDENLPSSDEITPVNPAMIMMAATMALMEKQLQDISKIEEEMLEFLKNEKSSEIDIDAELLFDIVDKYKESWQDEEFIATNHNLVVEIQRNARTNMMVYRKMVREMINSKNTLTTLMQVDAIENKLETKFRYYRLSLYTYTMASLLEILLSGNFKEDYINGIKVIIENYAFDYRKIYSGCSEYLEKLIKASIKTGTLKSIGTVGETVGKFIGNIPLVKDGKLDEILQESGSQLKENAIDIENNLMESFSTTSNPGITVFIRGMEDLIEIFNRTKEIAFDDEKISLVVEVEE